MTVATFVAGAAWAVGTSTVTPSDCTVTEVDTMTEATALAHECGHDVAAVDSYDPWTRLLATPGSAVRMEASAGAVRTDITGDWAPVDPSVVVDDATGELKVASPVYDITLDPQDGEGFAAISTADGETLSVDVPVDLGEPTVDGSRVTWPILDKSGSAIDGAVLAAEVHADATGVTPVIEVQDPAAYDRLQAASGSEGVGFEFTASDGLKVTESGADGGFRAVDADTGSNVFTGGAPLQWDSSATVADTSAGTAEEPTPSATDEADGDEAVALTAGDQTSVMDVDVKDEQTVVVTADEQMVNDPDTTWPIAIDPPIEGITRNEWTDIRTVTAWGSKYKSDDSEGVGLCDVQAASDCQQDYKSRLIWEFTGMTLLKQLDPGDIISATFSAYGTHSYDCAGNSLQLHLLKSGISSSTTWANQPDSEDNLDSQYPVHRSGQCGSPSWIKWDATAAAKARAGVSTGFTLELKSPTESSMSSWRRYKQNNATLTITYNRAPSTPTAMTVAGKACGTGSNAPYVTTDKPILALTASDPDGQNIQVVYDVDNGSTAVWDYTSSAESGKSHSASVPVGKLKDGVRYKWRARVVDTDDHKLYSAWSGYCEFVADFTKPAAPTISPLSPTAANSTIKAVYPAGQERGGVGLTGCFKFVSTSSDVASIDVKWNSSVAVTTATTTAGFTACMPAGEPKAAGAYTITATSRDEAGNLSPDQKLSFTVATPREDGVWTFDSKSSPVADQSTAGSSGPLAVQGGTSWVTGPHTLFDARSDDYALDFNGTSGEASTAAPVFDTRQSFVVSAFVRLDEATKFHTALIQEGPWKNAWRLSYLPSGCPMAGWTGGCWAFVLYATDGGTWKAVYSPVKPVVGQWTHLTAEFDQPEKKVRIWVCDIGTPDDPAPGQPVMSEAAGPDPMWRAPGPVVVGRGQIDGAKSDWWDGAIDDVRLFKGEVVADAKVRRMCQGAEANQFSAGQAALDPTTVTGK